MKKNLTLLTFVQTKNQLKNQAFIIPVGVTRWQRPLLQLAPSNIAQGCIGSESLATYFNFTDTWFDPSLSHNKARTSTTRTSGR